ncbi:hypothetical protein K493DRAFT_263093 [Basidiobolus meristosporus CBS 931.73]|uniref:U2 snRNP-associated SURP motif-containing protein n=1 Tax=Basidiobolus meristosporus CBS 931.73 TaxID=1314790 RepID=A0A1Y1Y413_9FUNG|nr:hypothetical protein K493DRAFT_263093 [Basidiobolus meristosporus CBS 931.73]|eukprot:ORX92772.1 hypothetical protein K493DRAFT_263093 [Basidiobolus meristosporus CBS 931.73]
MPFENEKQERDKEKERERDKEDRPKKLPWGVTPETLQPGTIKQITKDKLQAFSVGKYKKTAFQKHREELEMKKKKETEDAAKVYAEFVASFEEEPDMPKAFVKGGTLTPKDSYRSSTQSDSMSTSSLLKPQMFVSAGQTATSNKTPSAKNTNSPEYQQTSIPQYEEEIKTASRTEEKGKKKRNLDSFLEEIKKEQEQREERLRQKRHIVGSSVGPTKRVHQEEPGTTSLTVEAAFEDKSGSHDTGDPDTTNLYIGNISPLVNEETLCKEFGRYGPIASVKIMWPRTPEEKERNRNCGFISFMKRDDAMQALKSLDGQEIKGHAIRVGWGKAVTLPAKPIFVLANEDRKEFTGHPFNAKPIASTPAKSAYATIPPPGAIIGSHPEPKLEIHVVRPKEQALVKLIHKVVERVLLYGPSFEAVIMEREVDNPKFSFLFKHESPEHVYYRWKLFSMLQGDQKGFWRTEPFYMFDEGAIWIPPEIPFNEESAQCLSESDYDSENDLEEGPKGALSRRAKAHFEKMLRQISNERGSIARLMAFAIDHAGAFEEVVDIVVKSLTIPETPIPTKIARLHLISDILHNSSVPLPNAWKLRSGFESKLPIVFTHLAEVYNSIQGRLKAEHFRRQVMNVVGAWEKWIIFPQPYLDSLASSFAEPGSQTVQSEVTHQDPQSQDHSEISLNEAISSEPSAVDNEHSVEDPQHTAVDVEGSPTVDNQAANSPEKIDKSALAQQLQEKLTPEQSEIVENKARILRSSLEQTNPNRITKQELQDRVDEYRITLMKDLLQEEPDEIEDIFA